MVVVAGKFSEQKAAAHSLKLGGRARADVRKSDGVEHRQLVGVAARVILVTEKCADVAVGEFVIDLTLEQHVLDQLPNPNARLSFRKIEVEIRQRFAPLVCAAGSAREH